MQEQADDLKCSFCGRYFSGDSATIICVKGNYRRVYCSSFHFAASWGLKHENVESYILL
jgi:hypothetical protein